MMAELKKADPLASRIDELWRDLMSQMRELRLTAQEATRRAEAADKLAVERRNRVRELEASRAGLKATVVALVERLVRLEARMANAGDPAPPLTSKEQSAIDSAPADVREKALTVGLEAQKDEERKARFYHPGGPITGDQTRPTSAGQSSYVDRRIAAGHIGIDWTTPINPRQG